MERFAFTVSETGERRRALAENSQVTDAQTRRVSDRYVKVDPSDLIPKFEQGGFRTRLFEEGMGMHGRRRQHTPPSPWNKILEVREAGSEFDRSMKILFNHEGRRALLFQPGLVYVACENQFMAPCHRIRHDTPDQVEIFMQDPAGYVRTILADLDTLHEKREKLQAVGNGRELLSVLAPKHWNTYRQADRLYRYRYGGSGFKAALDAVTNTHSKTGNEFAKLCFVDEIFPQLQNGKVPDGLRLQYVTSENEERLQAACAAFNSPVGAIGS